MDRSPSVLDGTGSVPKESLSVVACLTISLFAKLGSLAYLWSLTHNAKSPYISWKNDSENISPTYVI